MNIPATVNNLAIASPLKQNGQTQHFDRDRPATEDSRRQSRTAQGNAPSDVVFRGELLDVVDQQQPDRPPFNRQIPARNQLAIENYLSSASGNNGNDPRGRLLDQYV